MKATVIAREVVLFVKDVFVTTSVIFLIVLFVGIVSLPAVGKHVASTISNQSQDMLQEYGFDIFKEPTKHVPDDIKQQLNKKDEKKIDLLEKIKRFPDVDWIDTLLRWSGIIGFIRGVWKFIKRKCKAAS